MNVRGVRPISLALLMALTGCGDPDGLNLAPVRGKVFLHGKPAPAGFVVFETDPASGNSGPAAMGQILEDGSYIVTTKLSGDGATIGPNRVGIIVYDPKPLREASEKAKKDVIAAKGESVRRARAPQEEGPTFVTRGNVYRLLSPEKLKGPPTSGIAVEVAPGSNTFDFSIHPDDSVSVSK